MPIFIKEKTKISNLKHPSLLISSDSSESFKVQVNLSNPKALSSLRVFLAALDKETIAEMGEVSITENWSREQIFEFVDILLLSKIRTIISIGQSRIDEGLLENLTFLCKMNLKTQICIVKERKDEEESSLLKIGASSVKEQNKLQKSPFSLTQGQISEVKKAQELTFGKSR